MLLLTARYSLALLLLAAGLHKSVNAGSFREAIAAYCPVLIRYEMPVSLLVVGVEVTVGAALMIPNLSRLASLAAATVFGVYLTAMGLSWLRGDREVECGCSFHDSKAPLSGSHLVRNGLLALSAAVASGPGSGRAVSFVDGLQITTAVACLAIIYLSVDALLAHPENVAGREA